MPHKKPRFAFRQADALKILEEVIAETGSNGHSMLPSLTDLSKRCHVARATVLHALNRLCESGALVRIQNRGYQIPSLPPPVLRKATPVPDAPADHPHSSVDRVKLAIITDITTRIHPPGGALPGLKQLQHRFNVSHKTLLSALTLLEQQHVIERRGRVFFVCSAVPRTNSASITFIINKYISLNSTTANSYTRDLWRTLEEDCYIRGIYLSVRTNAQIGHSVAHVRSALVDLRAEGTSEENGVLGYALWTLSFKQEVLVATIQDLLKTNRPVAVLDDAWETVWPDHLLNNRQLRIIGVGHPENLGTLMGEHLAELGHRSIAFFSNDRVGIHSNGRIAGIKKSFSIRNIPVSVKQYWIDATRITKDPHQLHDAFDQELKAGNATAWVAFNDQIGLEALEWLQLHNRRVPQEISVAGFDNTLESFVRSLTSISLNSPAAVPLMINHVLGDGDHASHRARTMIVEGRRIARASTGPVARGAA